MALVPGRSDPFQLAGSQAEAFGLGIVQTDVWTRRRVIQLGGVAGVVAAGADGNVYATNLDQRAIDRMSPLGTEYDYNDIIYQGGNYQPTGIAASADGKLYVVGNAFDAVSVYDLAAGTWMTIGSGLNNALGVAVG